MIQYRQVVDLHVHAPTAVSVLYKDKAERGQLRLEAEMSRVVLARRIPVAQAVQAVFERVIRKLFICKIIAYGIRIAENIPVFILCKINRHKLLLELPQPPLEPDSLPHV